MASLSSEKRARKGEVRGSNSNSSVKTSSTGSTVKCIGFILLFLNLESLRKLELTPSGGLARFSHESQDSSAHLRNALTFGSVLLFAKSYYYYSENFGELITPGCASLKR
jgi:hypothetical protein